MATKTTLKGYFETGDTPTQSQFESLIDSYPSYDDDMATKYKKVSVSSAEILALNTSPKELVAAPGTGKYIMIQKVYFVYNFGTAAYDTTDSFPKIIIGTEDDISEGNVSIGVYDSNLGNNKSWITVGVTENHLFNLSANSAIKIAILNANPTAGDGTLDIHLWYSEVTL